MAHDTQSLRVLVALRELYNGDWIGFPLAQPEAVSYETSRDDIVLELEMYLSEYLSRARADRLSDFASPLHARLLEVEVPMAREDLPRRLKSTFSAQMPCVIVDETWAIILPLQHTLYVRKVQDIERAIIREATRYVTASELSPTKMFEIFAGRSHELAEVEIALHRQANLSEQAQSRKKLARARKTKHAVELLREIGRELGGCHAPRPTLVGREQPRQDLEALLDGATRLGAVVVGPQGCGKSVVIADVVGRTKRVYATSGAQLVAGQSYFGQWQQRVHDVMQAAEHVDAILWFDDLADLFAARDGSSGIASIMRPYLDDRRVRVVGELRPEDVDAVQSRNYGFFQNLHTVRVEPIGPERTREVLRARQRDMRRVEEGAPVFSPHAMARIVELVDRYEPYRAFPGKAVALFDALSTAHADALAQYVGDAPDAEVGEREVFATFSDISGVPQFLLRRDLPLSIERVEGFFHERIIGQRAAIRRVAQAVCTVKASLQPKTKPLANLLFIGPTGVGKTEVARTLAKFLFGSDRRMIRFDMSEYMAPGAAQRLIHGTDRDDGLLTRAIRRQPFSVVLLDEIEKAHPSVFDLLLQVLGEGRLSDARGRTAYFHNAIVIMTSNLGAAHRRAEVGFAHHDASSAEYYVEQVETHFRPEFVNRLDRIVSFDALTPAQIEEVTHIGLRLLRERRGLAERGITMEVTPAAVAALAAAGYSEAYGARHLRRHLDDHLAAPMAEAIASAGEDARGALIDIRARGEAALEEVRADEILAERRLEDVHIVMICRGKREVGRGVTSIDAISELRRECRHWRRSWRVERLDDRIGFLSSQLDIGKKRSKRITRDHEYAAEVGRMASEREQSRAVLDTLDDALGTIREIEELAVSAVIDGEDPTPFFAHVEDAELEFWGALAHALLSEEESRDHIVLLLRECDDQGALSCWLPAFLESAAAREWEVTGHILRESADELEGIVTASPQWPTTAPFCSAVEPQMLRQWLATSEAPRGVMLDVQGDWAGGLLATEVGIIEFEKAPRTTDVARLEVRAASFEYTPKDLAGRSELSLGERPQGIALRNAARSRIYDFHSRRLTVRDEVFGRLEWEEYFPQYEAIAARDLLRFERDRELNRREHLFTAEFDTISLDEIRATASAGLKIKAIKMYREVTGAGLKDAKNAVERMMEDDR